VLAESGPPELVEQLSAIERAGETSQRLAAASTFTNGVTCALGGALLGAAVLLGGLETNRAIGLSVGVGLLVVALWGSPASSRSGSGPSAWAGTARQDAG